jgi:hypothetical protein
MNTASEVMVHYRSSGTLVQVSNQQVSCLKAVSKKILADDQTREFTDLTLYIYIYKMYTYIRTYNISYNII